MKIFMIICAALAGYLIGSINTSILVGKCYGVDIRTKGSGNAGATNAVRVLGKLPGVLVFLGDFAKGVLACWIASKFIGWGAIAGGAFAVIGHNFPVFFKFKGGKGISTSLGVLLFMDYRIALIVSGVLVLLILTTQMVSVGSLTAFFAAPFITYFMNPGFYHINTYVTIFLCVLTFYAHRKNIVRILNGTENKIGKKSQ